MADPRLPRSLWLLDLVITRGTPPRLEGCRPASRGLTLALMTSGECRQPVPPSEMFVHIVGAGYARMGQPLGSIPRSSLVITVETPGALARTSQVGETFGPSTASGRSSS